ncbi:MAG: dihydroorotase [Prevotellaceae bacterium]|nr:dihydroorotase [Prevotella sp.]MDD7256903.1 dihydroorotase [Prevotellaceae bacterium]MDY6129747.1 dihydroorotase [Prevotella sp.]
MKTLISNATIVNEGHSFSGSLVIENDRIVDVIEDTAPPHGHFDTEVNATGSFVLPGIIDDHVHFREPGLTEKACIESESRAAAFGGVTSFFEMPNTVPQTTSIETLEEKYAIAKEKSHVNYAFFFGATNNNAHLFPLLDTHHIPGIKLFMGSSTGNMLVNQSEALKTIFSTAPLPIMAHCEDTSLISANMKAAKEQSGNDPDIRFHPRIRSGEACYRSTALAVELAKTYQAHLHVAHLTTERELQLFDPAYPNITAEATVSHLFFSEDDYSRLGTRIKCNPAIKSRTDRDALRKALTDGRITLIGTDHAPHLLKDKEGGAAKAASGMPMIQFSLVTMLELMDAGVLSIERLVELMCHHPALLFEVRNRGFLRKGYKADIVVVKPGCPWKVTEGMIQSKCKWSPMLGHEYRWQVQQTFCNGHLIYNKGIMDENYRGEELRFR